MASLPDVAVGVGHVAAHNAERHLLNQAKSSSSPLHRQRNNFRRLGPVSTDVTSAVANASHDATLTKSYYTPVTGMTSGTVRKMTDAEYAAQPYIQYPECGANPRIWDNTGIGYIMPGPNPLSVDETYQFPAVTSQRFEFMTDAPAVELVFYAYLGLTVSSLQAYVDGAPVSLTPTAYSGAIVYYKITFPTGKKPRLVEVVTEGLFTYMSVAPNYRCWKPAKRRGPKVMVLGASLVQPIVYDSASGAQVFNRYGHWQQMDSAGDFDRLVTEGIGGTGFVTAAASGVGYPTNTYQDRVQGVINTAPDVIIFADAFSNDLHAAATTDSIVTSVKACVDAIKGALPRTKIVFQTGLRGTLYGDFSSGVDTVKTAIKAAYTDLYWIDMRNIFDTTGGYTPGHTNGLGNTDFYLGNDGIHPTKEGCDYMRGQFYPAIQKILWDDGTYAGTELLP